MIKREINFICFLRTRCQTIGGLNLQAITWACVSHFQVVHMKVLNFDAYNLLERGVLLLLFFPYFSLISQEMN